MNCLILNICTYKKHRQMHTRRNFGKKSLPSWKIPKFVGINFTNVAKVIKAANEAKVTKVL